MKAIEFMAMFFVFIGMGLMIIPKRSAIWCFMVGQILWLIYGYLINAEFLVLQNIVLIIVNVITFINWKKKGVGE